MPIRPQRGPSDFARTGPRPSPVRLQRASAPLQDVAPQERHFSGVRSFGGPQLEEKLAVRFMGSMLSKVHALNAKDGLPIYDSRMAAAISALAETHRRDVLRSPNMPTELSFPAVLPRLGS